MSDAKWLPEVDPNPAEPRMVIWSTLRCLELQIDQHEELYDSHGVVSWELLKHMVRLAKRHAHEEGGKAEAAERETDQWRTRADEANAKLREAEQELQRLRQAHLESQSEELTEARATIADLQQQLDAAHSDFALAEAGTLRHQLDAANAAETLQRTRIERLHKFVGKARLAMWPEDLKSALAELDAGTEPTPVAEPAPCPECERLRAVIDQAWQRIQQSISHADVAGLLAALAEIQSNSSATLTSSPTPVAEPLDADGGA